MTAPSPIVLEPAARQVADAFSKPPFLYEMAPADARKVLEDAQSAPISKLPVDEEWITVTAAVGDVRVRIIKPQALPACCRSSSICMAEAGSSATPTPMTGWCVSSPLAPARRSRSSNGSSRADPLGDPGDDHGTYATCRAGPAPIGGSHSAASMSETSREEHRHDCPQPDRP